MYPERHMVAPIFPSPYGLNICLVVLPGSSDLTEDIAAKNKHSGVKTAGFRTQILPTSQIKGTFHSASISPTCLRAKRHREMRRNWPANWPVQRPPPLRIAGLGGSCSLYNLGSLDLRTSEKSLQARCGALNRCREPSISS